MVETESLKDFEKLETSIFPVEQGKDTTNPINTKTSTLITPELISKSQELQEIRKLPKSPGKKITFPELEEWFKLITKPEQWNRISGYMYRLHPGIIRQLADSESYSYIDVITEEGVNDPDGGLFGYIKRTHGAGRYKIIITDLDEKVPRATDKDGKTLGGPGSRPLMESVLSIPITDECMPILNYKELDFNEKRNYGYIQMLKNKGIINDKGDRMVNTTTEVNGNAAEVATVMASQNEKAMATVREMGKENLQVVREAFASKKNDNDKGVTDLLLEKLKQDDPNKHVGTMANLITAMSSLIPKPVPVEKHSENGNTELVKMMLQMQQDSNNRALENQKFQTEMMMKMMETLKGDSILEKIIAYKDILPGLFGANSSSEPKTTTEVIVEKLSDIALPAIGLFSQMIQARTGATPIIPTNGQQAQETVRMMTGPRAVGPQLVQPSTTPQVITQGPVSSEPINNATAPANAPAAVSQPQQQQEVDIITRLLTTYGGLLITSIKSGATGEDLATQCITLQPMLGMDVYTMLCSKGKDELLNRMKSIPQFWNQTGLIFGDEHMNTLVEDFINGPIDDNEDDVKGEGA